MKDISHKTSTLRTALARAVLKLSPSLIERMKSGQIPKGDPLPVAKVAAIQAAKNTHQIIPYCHPLPVDYVKVDFELLENTVIVNVFVKAIYKTGVEMEALTAASVAALTIYDMLKVFDESMEIGAVQLIEKRGGKSDFQMGSAKRLRAAVLVVSDSVSQGKKQDRSGTLIVERLEKEGVTVGQYKVVPDDETALESCIKEFADKHHYDIVISTGGTGLGPRDRTPEVIKRLVDMEIPGIAEAFRSYGQDRVPTAMLSRSIAGVRGRTLIISLPGASSAVCEGLDTLIPSVFHIVPILAGAGHGDAYEDGKHRHEHDDLKHRHEHKDHEHEDGKHQHEKHDSARY